MDELTPYRDFARPLYDGKDIAHDFRHVERIISRLDSLSEGLIPPPSRHRLYFLACFHGLGPRIDRDPELRKKTISFLRSLGWQDTDIQEALSSLATHLYHPRTADERVVHDANYFEVPGALGIAKAFTVGGTRGQSYEQTLEVFERNLDRVLFRTPAGKRSSEKRKAYAKDFIRKLREEL